MSWVMGPLPFPIRIRRLMEDSLWLHGQDEAGAESWRAKYDKEMGLPHGPYTREPDAVDAFQGYAQLSPAQQEDRREGFAACLAGGSLEEDAVEGKTRTEAVKNLNHTIEQIHENSGVDLHKHVAEYLRSPAPAEETEEAQTAPLIPKTSTRTPIGRLKTAHVDGEAAIASGKHRQPTDAPKLIGLPTP